ncbi:hypothetical protein SNE40_005501 [Patella caerulea]|uniref:Uncharacterized protein n=1 Tax=Patella caerulea TaxID=87958 RepID=A0AAN8K807_PATCE
MRSLVGINKRFWGFFSGVNGNDMWGQLRRYGFFSGVNYTRCGLFGGSMEMIMISLVNDRRHGSFGGVNDRRHGSFGGVNDRLWRFFGVLMVRSVISFERALGDSVDLIRWWN